MHSFNNPDLAANRQHVQMPMFECVVLAKLSIRHRNGFDGKCLNIYLLQDHKLESINSTSVIDDALNNYIIFF